MYTEYLLPVEIVGVLLLMAIIGGVIMVRRLSSVEESNIRLVSVGTGNLDVTEKVESDVKEL